MKMKKNTSLIIKQSNVSAAPMELTTQIKQIATILVKIFPLFLIWQPFKKKINILRNIQISLLIIWTKHYKIWLNKEFLTKNALQKHLTLMKQLFCVPSCANKNFISLIWKRDNAYFVIIMMNWVILVLHQFQDIQIWPITTGLLVTMIRWGLFNGEMI